MNPKSIYDLRTLSSFSLGYVGFVGSQPTLLLLHQTFRQASNSNNVAVTPQILRTFFYFFINTCHNYNKKNRSEFLLGK